MTMVLSAHDIIWFRRSCLDWEVHQVFLRGAEVLYIELIEELPADTVRWALRRAGSRAILSKRGIHADVPALLFDETLATHRAAIITCVEQQLAEALVDLQDVRKRAREIHAAIATIEGGPATR